MGIVVHPVWGYEGVDGVFTGVFLVPGEIRSDLIGSSISLPTTQKLSHAAVGVFLAPLAHHSGNQNIYRKIDI